MGSWISDTELTIRQNAHMAEFPAADIEAVRNMLGKIRWEVTASNLTVIRPETVQPPAYEYSIRITSDAELAFTSEGAGDMTIRRVGNGICADFPTRPNSNPLLVSECFTRYIL